MLLIFQSARVRLTLWYLLIVSIVSISFSAIIYHDVMGEIRRGFQAAEMRLQTQQVFLPNRGIALSILADDWERARKLVLLRLIAINTAVISLSGIAAYFLAGKTLAPLEAAVEEQKRFISDASHELRTPLTAIKSEIEVALRDKRLTSKQASQLLQSNLEEVDKMQKLSNYLLSLSRYESASTKLKKEKLDLAKITQEVIDSHHNKAINQKVAITPNLKQVFLFANKTSIEELIGILLDNAIKYTPEEGEILVEVKQNKKDAVLKISDTGVGIKASEIPYIFNRFYRADSARSKTKTDGYGLGLSIAKSIVEMYEGAINVKSNIGRGTSFTVNIPL